MPKLIDDDLAHMGEISVKLRRASDNAKIQRRPFHIELAVKSLVQEYCDLSGAEWAIEHLLSEVFVTIAADMGRPATAQRVISVGVQALVNLPQHVRNDDDPTSHGLGVLIVEEVADIFEDMDLGVNLREALAK